MRYRRYGNYRSYRRYYADLDSVIKNVKKQEKVLKTLMNTLTKEVKGAMKDYEDNDEVADILETAWYDISNLEEDFNKIKFGIVYAKEALEDQDDDDE